MLDHLKPDLAEMLDLTAKISNYDATLAAMHMAGQPIEPNDAAHDERRRREQRLNELRSKWGF